MSAPVFEMRLEGGKELEVKLALMERKVRDKIRKDAVRGGAKVVLAAAKVNAKGIAGPSRKGKKRMSVLISRALRLAIGKHPRNSQHYYVRVEHNPKFNADFVSFTLGSASALSTIGRKGQIVPGKQVSGRRHYIPNAIEYGHSFPGEAGGGKSVAARPYLRPAFDSRKARAIAVIKKELFSGVERAWRVG